MRSLQNISYMRICTPYEIVLANPSLTLHQKRATQVLKAYSTIQLLHQKHTVPCNSCTKSMELLHQKHATPNPKAYSTMQLLHQKLSDWADLFDAPRWLYERTLKNVEEAEYLRVCIAEFWVLFSALEIETFWDMHLIRVQKAKHRSPEQTG